MRRGTPVEPIVAGGGQEFGLRAGTENVAGIAAFTAALLRADAERAVTAERVRALRDRFENGVAESIDRVRVNGAGAPRLPNIASIAFADAAADALLIRLDLEGIAASTGSACAAGSAEPSHVVAAIALSEEYRGGVIRFSLGRMTTAVDIEEVLRRLPAAVAGVRDPLPV